MKIRAILFLLGFYLGTAGITLVGATDTCTRDGKCVTVIAPVVVVPKITVVVRPTTITTVTVKPVTTNSGGLSSTSSTTSVVKPKATVTAVANPFVKPTVVIAPPRSGSATAWRTALFGSANGILSKNLTVADMPSCAAGQDGNCIASASSRTTLDKADMDNDAVPAKPIERRRALVIGNSEYASPITQLPGTAKDAIDVSKALSDKGFEVVSLADASRDSTVRAFNQLIRTAGENDSVVVYYAGHGHIHPSSTSGFWLPADADVENPKTWLSNADIGKMLANIPAKQILLVSDSCFSGALTRETETTKTQDAPVSANAILKRRSVAVMSSGSEEPVADSTGDGNSPFAEALLRQLADIHSSKEPLRAQTVLSAIRTEVSKQSNQTPQYGVLMSAGHTTGGDYLFDLK